MVFTCMQLMLTHKLINQRTSYTENLICIEINEFFMLIFVCSICL